jgi:hypothetical protein
MADERWISVLPQVFDLLLHKADRIVDDTSTEKLLACIADVCGTPDGLATFLKQETGALHFLTSEKLHDSSSFVGAAFALRLCGILWSKGYNFEDFSAVIDLFTRSRESEGLWNEAVVRNGYFTGLESLTLSNEGLQWLHTNQGEILIIIIILY